MPAPGFSPGFLVAFLAISLFELIFITVFAVPLFTDFDGSGVALVFVCVFLFFFLALPTLFLVGLLGNTFLASQSVMVSDQELAVTKGWPLRKSQKVSNDQIEEFTISSKTASGGGRKPAISIGGGKEIRAISDDIQLSFGTGLPEDELVYIHALAKGILVS